MKRSQRAGGETPGRVFDLLAAWGPAAAVLLLHALYATTFGIFRDELYYLSCARRLAWGYVDHPPLVAWATAGWTALFGSGLATLRFLPALAVAATTWVVGSTARAFGGGRFATALAGLAFGLAPILLGLASVLSMNAFDLLFWALLMRLVAGLLTGADERHWLTFGAVAGIGLLNKVSVLFAGFGIVCGLVLARRWQILKSRWFWLGGVVAFAIFLPHLVWQQIHGWPTLEFMENARNLKNADLSTADFLRRQLLNTGPVNCLVWLPGLAGLFFLRDLRRFRALGWAYLAVLVLLLTTASKPYYLAPAYAVLFAAGAVAIEQSTARWRGRTAIRAAFVALLVLLSLAVAPLARPMLPVESYLRYAARFGEKPGTDEKKEVGRLKQFYADMQEWHGLAEAVGQAADRLSPTERRGTCVFAENYGEAGAVERWAAELDLPPAISGHNSWFLWGPGECLGKPTLLVIARDRERLDKLFASVEPGAEFHCRDCMPYENGLTVWIAREPRVDLAALWPSIKNFS
ncbi:MAG: glycosyltransferase family 39 protein [Thermoanaerobaculia bacterium]